MTPLLADFVVGGVFGVGIMLALSALPRLSYLVFLIGLTGMAAIITLEGADGFIAILDRAIDALLAAVPSSRLAGLSAGTMLAAMLTSLSAIRPEDPK